LLEARSVLARWIVPHFKTYRFDFTNKRLVSGDGKYALIWSVGDTNRGSVGVFELKKRSNPRRKRRSYKRNSPRRHIIQSLKRYTRKTRRNTGRDYDTLAKLLKENHYFNKHGVWLTDYSKIRGFKILASTTNGTSGTGMWRGHKVYFHQKGNNFVVERG
jgi:hypothetical protein